MGPATVPGLIFCYMFYLQIEAKQRTDERTRTADLLVTSVASTVARRCANLQDPHK